MALVWHESCLWFSHWWHESCWLLLGQRRTMYNTVSCVWRPCPAQSAHTGFIRNGINFFVLHKNCHKTSGAQICNKFGGDFIRLLHFSSFKHNNKKKETLGWWMNKQTKLSPTQCTNETTFCQSIYCEKKTKPIKCLFVVVVESWNWNCYRTAAIFASISFILSKMFFPRISWVLVISSLADERFGDLLLV